MFDLEKLEQAGFEKTMTTEEWEVWSEQEQQRYTRKDPEAPGGSVAPGVITKNYVLKRDDVLIITEQNTANSLASGIPATIQYPEIVVVQLGDGPIRIACSADDADLILAVAEEVALGGRQLRARRK